MNKLDRLYEELDISRYDKNKQKYDELIEEIYKLIYDEMVYEDELALDGNFSFQIKEIIVQYINYQNQLVHFQDVNDNTRPVRVNEEIKSALNVLKKYNTPEYICLQQNNFYNPFVDRKPHKNSTTKQAETKYRNSFISKLINEKLPKDKCNRIHKNLITFIEIIEHYDN